MPDPIRHLRLEQPEALGFWDSLFQLIRYGVFALLAGLLFMASDSLVLKLGLGIVTLLVFLSAIATFWEGWGGEGRPTAMDLDCQGLRLSSALWNRSYPLDELAGIEYDDGLLMLETSDGGEWSFGMLCYTKEELKAFFASLGLICEEEGWNYLRMVNP